MTGQQLRNSILQEAIHGRLVPNVLQPGEKTGDDLLKDILAERQKKENEEKGKKAKKLTLSTIEEEPWELPEGWCWTSLSSLVDILNGYAFKSSLYVNEGYRVIRITNVQDGQIIDNEPKYYPLSQKDAIADYLLKEGDLLMSLTGNVGRVGIMNKELLPAALNQRVACLRLHKEEPITKLYLFWLFRSQFFLNESVSSSKGMAQLNMSTEWLKQFSVPYPPLSIQKAIVDKIEELLPLIDEYDKAAVELETLNKILPDKLRKSVLQEAIHGTLVPNDIPEGEATGAELLQQILKERQEKENKKKSKKAKKLTLSNIDEEPWELPDGWCWCKLGDVGSWGAGATPQRGKAEYYQGGTIPWLKTGELNNGVVYDTEEKVTELALEQCSLRLCQPDDVLIAMYGATIGKLAIAGTHLTTNQACCACTPYIGLFNKFLFFFLLAKKDDFTKQAFGGAQPNISKEKIVSTDFPLPPLSIQHRIVEKIEEVFAAIDNLPA